MSLVRLLKNVSNRIRKKRNVLFSYPVDKQKKIISSFNTPENDIERSYFQYKCQCKMNGIGVSFFSNLIALPLLLYYLVKKSDTIGDEKKYESVFFTDGKPVNIVPDELLIASLPWVTINDEKKEYFDENDKKFILNIWKKYPFSFHFLLKITIKVRFYSFVIKMYNPKKIIVCAEYSFTSSILTQYCAQKEVKHINVMHGEKMYFMRDSFFRFDDCYVWSSYYKNLFCSLRAHEEQFKVAVPKSLRLSSDKIIEKKVDYTYYLGNESNEKLEIIVNNLETLAERGLVVAIRPHPRYSNIEEIKKLCKRVIVEDLSSTPIEESVLGTRNAISRFSTVLNQAYNSGTNVVLDDVTDVNEYKKLIELGYFIFQVNHKLLSKVIKEVGQYENNNDNKECSYKD